MTCNTGGPVFPIAVSGWQNLPNGDNEWVNQPEGINLLDWFAGIALKGILENQTILECCITTARERQENIADTVARAAYGQALAMLAEKRRLENKEG